MVLCESTVNFQSKTLQGRRRPTLAVIPLPISASNRGCGRSFNGIYRTGCSGALGKCNCCGTLRNSFQAATISSVRTFFFKVEDGVRVLTVTGVQTCALPI